MEGGAGVQNTTKVDLINDLARAWSPFAAHHANIRNHFTASWDNSSFSPSLGHASSTLYNGIVSLALYPAPAHKILGAVVGPEFRLLYI